MKAVLQEWRQYNRAERFAAVVQLVGMTFWACKIPDTLWHGEPRMVFLQAGLVAWNAWSLLKLSWGAADRRIKAAWEALDCKPATGRNP